MKKLIYICIACLTAQVAMAQPRPLKRSGDTIKPKDVVIVKEFEPTISDAYKINDVPRIIDTLKPIEEEINYPVMNKQVPTYFEVSPIKPAVMRGEPLDRLYRAHLKGGYGLYNTAMGELYINNLRSRTKNYGFQAKHLSSTGNIKDVGYSGYSNSNAKLFGKQIFYNKILSGSVGYSHDRNHFYGFNPDTLPADIANDTLSKENIRQNFQKVDASLRFKSYYRDSSLMNFDLAADFYEVTDAYGVKEDNFTFDASLDRFYGQKHFFIDAGVNHNQYSDVLGDYNNTLVNIQPSLEIGGEKWRLRVAVKMMADADSVTTYHFYPIVFANYNVVGDLIIPYAGIEGGLTRNGFDQLRQVNPFITSTPVLAVSNKRYEFYGGIRGEFSSTSSFNLKASQKRIDNFPLFINNYGNVVANRFLVAYDTAEVTTLTGEMSFQKTDKLHLYMRGDYFIYKLNQEAKAWHYPPFKATVSARYDLRDKLVFTGDVFYLSEQFAKSFDPAAGEAVGYGAYAKKLKGTVDVNIGLEYRYNKKLAFWLDFNNIASINYQRWNHYPSQGFIVMGGLSYSFWGQ